MAKRTQSRTITFRVRCEQKPDCRARTACCDTVTFDASVRAGAISLDPEFVHDVKVQTPDGNTLNGWLLRHAKHDLDHESPLVVYFPGNSLNRSERFDDLREVASREFDVLIFDYRGYGDSSGSPSERALTSDARLVWEYASEELKYAENRIVVFGESLGGAVALSLWSGDIATHPRPAALILTSTFVSMPRLVAWHYPMFPFRFLVLDRWPSIDRVTAVRAPIIVFHGTVDDMVPVEHGRPKTWLRQRHRDHPAQPARGIHGPGLRR